MKKTYFNLNTASAEQRLHRMAITGHSNAFKDIIKDVKDKNPATLQFDKEKRLKKYYP